MATQPVTPAASTTGLSTLPGGSLRPRSEQAAVRLLEMMRDSESSENLQRLTLLVSMLQCLLHYTTNPDVLKLALWDSEARCHGFIDPEIVEEFKNWFLTEAAVARSTNKMAW